MNRKALLVLRWPVTLAVVSAVLWALGHGITVASISLIAAALLIGLGWLLLTGRRVDRYKR